MEKENEENLSPPTIFSLQHSFSHWEAAWDSHCLSQVTWFLMSIVYPRSPDIRLITWFQIQCQLSVSGHLSELMRMSRSCWIQIVFILGLTLLFGWQSTPASRARARARWRKIILIMVKIIGGDNHNDEQRNKMFFWKRSLIEMLEHLQAGQLKE